MRLIPIAGFPGAGKSLAALRLALELTQQGSRVRVCLQRENPITTALFREYDLRAEHVCPAEVRDADVVIVECDGLATAIHDRLSQLPQMQIAPLTVVVNPEKLHALAAYGAPLLGQAVFGQIVRAQLAEAQIVLLAHQDLHPASDAVRAFVNTHAPQAEHIAFSAKESAGTAQWLSALAKPAPASVPAISPVAASLTRYDCSLHVAAPIGFHPDRFLHLLGQKVRAALSQLPVPLASFQLATVSEEGVSIVSCTDLGSILREDRIVTMHSISAELHIQLGCVAERAYLCDLMYDAICHTVNSLERGVAVVGRYPDEDDEI